MMRWNSEKRHTLQTKRFRLHAAHTGFRLRVSGSFYDAVSFVIVPGRRETTRQESCLIFKPKPEIGIVLSNLWFGCMVCVTV
jgi:hypothetical protein